eukprot:TRINITY_DN16566_c0_g1_i1.p1 TRINITY_DN16566_c0_g1~~TRINITY_DN16566_c0_g1_i1.p1  ORF type:complete len:957 (+),score=192.66 TRINITY_DN16566_c0_g1_i1:108-2978(+)
MPAPSPRGDVIPPQPPGALGLRCPPSEAKGAAAGTVRAGQEVQLLRNITFSSGRGVLGGSLCRVTAVSGDIASLRLGGQTFDFDATDLRHPKGHANLLPGADPVSADTNRFAAGDRAEVCRTVRFEGGKGVLAHSLGTVQGPGARPDSYEVRVDPVLFDCSVNAVAPVSPPALTQGQPAAPAGPLCGGGQPHFSGMRGLPPQSAHPETVYGVGEEVFVARSGGGWTPGVLHGCDEERKQYIISFVDGAGGNSHKHVPFDHARWHLRPGCLKVQDLDDSKLERPPPLARTRPGGGPSSAAKLPGEYASAVQRLSEWLAAQPLPPAGQRRRPPAEAVAEWARTAGAAALGHTRPPQAPGSANSQWLQPAARGTLAAAIGPDGVDAVEDLLSHLAQQRCVSSRRQGPAATTAPPPPGPKGLQAPPPPPQRVYSVIRDWARWRDRCASGGYRSPVRESHSVHSQRTPGHSPTDKQRDSQPREAPDSSLSASQPREAPDSLSPPQPSPRSASRSASAPDLSRRRHSPAPAAQVSPSDSVPPAGQRTGDVTLTVTPPKLDEADDDVGSDHARLPRYSTAPPFAIAAVSPRRQALQQRASFMIQHLWRRHRRRVRLQRVQKESEPRTPTAFGQWALVEQRIDRMVELQAAVRQLSAIGSPSDADLQQLERTRHQYDSCKYDISAALRDGIPDGAQVTPPEGLAAKLEALLPEVCHGGDQREGSAELLRELLQRVACDWAAVIARDGLLPEQCADGNVVFLAILLDHTGGGQDCCDVPELLAAACFSQTARIPLTAAVLDRVDITPFADEVTGFLQDFFEDISSLKKLIPSEDCEGRHPLLRRLLTEHRQLLDLSREDHAGHTVFTRCCRDGDLLLLDLLGSNAPDTIKPTEPLADGTSGLIQAVIGGHAAMVRELCKAAGAEVDREAATGTALGVAEALQRKECIAALRAAGACSSVFHESPE